MCVCVCVCVLRAHERCKRLINTLFHSITCSTFENSTCLSCFLEFHALAVTPYTCPVFRTSICLSAFPSKYYLPGFRVVKSLQKLQGDTPAIEAGADQGHRLPTVDGQVQSFQNLQPQYVDERWLITWFGILKSCQQSCHLSMNDAFKIILDQLTKIHRITNPIKK